MPCWCPAVFVYLWLQIHEQNNFEGHGIVCAKLSDELGVRTKGGISALYVQFRPNLSVGAYYFAKSPKISV